MSDERLDPADRVGPDSDESILELFGVKLSVKNPRLAEILTMDAKDALTTDLRDLTDPAVIRERRAELHQAAPDILVTPETPRDAQETQARAEFRARVDNLACTLGFDLESGGVWNSPTGAVLVVREIDKDITFATASDFVHKLDVLRVSRGGSDAIGLFVTATQPACDIFKVAVRQAHLYGFVRTLSLDSLARLAGLVAAGALDHAQVVTIMLPIAAADIGEIVSLLPAPEQIAE